MRKALGTAALAAVGAVMAAACGGETGLRVFRDNFDSLASGWQVSEGVSVEEGSLRLTAGQVVSPEATYTFPDPYGLGWELETSIDLPAGLACLAIQVYAGDVRRHTWALEVGFYADTVFTVFDWSLQVGDGPDAWEAIGISPGQQRIPGSVQSKIRVSRGGGVTVWMQDAEVLSETIPEVSQGVVSVTLKASRCRIRAGIVTVDWIEIAEIG